MLILPSDIARFEAKIDKKESGCWEWTSTLSKAGYGRMWLHGTQVIAHRFSYQLYVGDLDPKLSIDHLCQNPKCVNPKHLEQVPMRVNLLRATNSGWARKKRWTHCVIGHEFTPENTAYRKNGTRLCRACNKRRQQELRDARKTTRA